MTEREKRAMQLRVATATAFLLQLGQAMGLLAAPKTVAAAIAGTIAFALGGLFVYYVLDPILGPKE